MTHDITTREDSPTCFSVSINQGEDVIGQVGRTSFDREDMRWKWEGVGSFGYCASQDEAVAQLHKRIPEFLESKAIDEAALAEYEALPDDLRALKDIENDALINQWRVWGRNPFDAEAWKLADARRWEARHAFDRAHSARNQGAAA